MNKSHEFTHLIHTTINANNYQLQSTDLTVLCLCITLIILTWLTNCILLGGILQTKGNGKNVSIIYFFIGSQAIAALLHVTLNLPPSIVNILFGTSQVHSYVHIFCLYSIYLDTLFCNLTFLQTFFSSLDTYLRLKNPIFYLSSSYRRPALWLKIGSPWFMACIQSIGQITLSDRRHVKLYTGTIETSSSSSSSLSSVTSYHVNSYQHYSMMNKDPINDKQTNSEWNKVCLLLDPNFLIIRTVIAYALPLITCLILIVLQLYGLHRLRNHSPEMLNALLNVRYPRNNNSTSNNNNNNNNTREYNEGMCSQDSVIPKHEVNHFKRQNTQFVWREKDTGLLNNIHSIFDGTMSNRILLQNPQYRQLSMMTNSYQLNPSYTNETLLLSNNGSIDRIQLNQSSISPTRLSTSYLPTNHLSDLQTTVSTSISMFECPTHGRITMTNSISRISNIGISENGDQTVRNQISSLVKNSETEMERNSEKHSYSTSITTNSNTITMNSMSDNNHNINSLFTGKLGSNTSNEEPITSNAFLFNLDGEQVKLLSFNHSYEPLNSTGLDQYHYYLSSMMSPTSFPELSSSPSCQHQLLRHQHTSPMTSQLDFKLTHGMHKSKSDYQIKCRNEMTSTNDRLLRSHSLKPSYQQQEPFHQSQILSNEKNGNDMFKTNLWLTAYQGEQLVVAINLVSCIIAVGTWSPYILVTLAYGLCQPINIPKSLYHQMMNSYGTSSISTNYPLSSIQSISSTMNDDLNLSDYSMNKCWIHLSVDRIADFRWWAYACSGLLLPCLLFFLDLGLREGCWKALQLKTESNQNIDSTKSLSNSMNKQSIIDNELKSVKVSNHSDNHSNRLCDHPSTSHNINTDCSINTESISKLYKLQQFEMISTIPCTQTNA
ncbi:unnamed protein product [Schistosoma mattheei]|uniref:Uncharacterized protein n=1 Tax=Schistosoma mattheei TaxID=31246 RepID=A0A183P3L0_9TREM|nr:unnamed protein product [Schistosoma mattheei]